jgi:hypothetical protein
VVLEVQAGQRIAVGDEGELAERAVDYRMSGVHTW